MTVVLVVMGVIVLALGLLSRHDPPYEDEDEDYDRLFGAPW